MQPESDVDSESDQEELTRALNTDRSGRLAGVRGLCYESRSFRDFLSPEAAAAVKADCLVLDGRAAGLDATFWLPAAAKPRFGLEALARAVFEYHTAGAVYPKERSGAEWWVQVRSASAAEGSAGASNHIGFHWDMDLDVMRSHGLALHPHLSTVTYLSDVGGPTLVVPQRRPDAERGVRLRPRRACTVSFPAVAKHFCFDGRFLHGVPKPRAAAAAAGMRVTFLVNIWLGYKPAGVEPFAHRDPASGAELDPGLAHIPAAAAAGRGATPVEPLECAAASDDDEMRHPIMWVGDEVDVEMAAAAPPLPETTALGPTVAMSAGLEGAAAVRFEEGLRGKRRKARRAKRASKAGAVAGGIAKAKKR
jgi:hypothetical protein